VIVQEHALKISVLIETLTELQAAHGDVAVECEGYPEIFVETEWRGSVGDMKPTVNLSNYKS
jgi:hypothetical protein